MAFKKRLTEQTLGILVAVLVCSCSMISVSLIYWYDIPFLLNVIMNTTNAIQILKAISYSHVLYTTRFYQTVLKKEIKYSEENLQQEVSPQNREIMEKYKDNMEEFITVKNLLYFILVPTLCYQLHYPKTQKIRKFWLL